MSPVPYFPPWLPTPLWLQSVEGVVTDQHGSCNLRAIGSLQEIQDLYIMSSNLGDSEISSIHQFRNLKSLSIRDSVITDRGVGSIVKCRQLERLRIQSPHVTNAGLKRVAELNLRSLEVCAKITDSGLAHLANVPTLTELSLIDAEVGSGFRHLAASGIRSVTLRHCIVDDGCISSLISIVGLRTLVIDECHVANESLKDLAGATIETLSLSGPEITDRTLKAVSDMRGLNVLIVDQAGITDAGIAHLRELRLKRLSITRCRVTDEGLSALHELPIWFLDLCDTGITPGGALSFRDSGTLKVLRVDSKSFTEDELLTLRMAGVPVIIGPRDEFQAD